MCAAVFNAARVCVFSCVSGCSHPQGSPRRNVSPRQPVMSQLPQGPHHRNLVFRRSLASFIFVASLMTYMCSFNRVSFLHRNHSVSCHHSIHPNLAAKNMATPLPQKARYPNSCLACHTRLVTRETWVIHGERNKPIVCVVNFANDRDTAVPWRSVWCFGAIVVPFQGPGPL